MIASLNGVLSYKSSDAVIVDVGGVGYRVLVSQQSFTKLPATGSKVLLLIHTAVREDDITLFGFVEENEKIVFQKLITVNGIGPKLAMTILSGILPQDLADAIHQNDLVRLTSISGIGKKTAERIVLDLKDKFLDFRALERGSTGAPGRGKIFEEVVSALVNLGYTRPIAERTMSNLSFEEGVPVEVVIRESLKRLSEAHK